MCIQCTGADDAMHIRIYKVGRRKCCARKASTIPSSRNEAAEDGGSDQAKGGKGKERESCSDELSWKLGGTSYSAP